MMSDDDITRIRRNWAQAVSVRDLTASTFYRHLFSIDPGTIPLFKGDMDMQGRKLVDTLAFVIDHVEAPDQIMPAAIDLAHRHVAYGVTQEQYASVGAALIQTLRDLLGEGFSPEDEAAWTGFYGTLSSAMIAAAYPV